VLGSGRREKGVMRGKKLLGSLNPNKMTYVMFLLISLTVQKSQTHTRFEKKREGPLRARLDFFDEFPLFRRQWVVPSPVKNPAFFGR
jgi:hypothetical protein